MRAEVLRDFDVATWDRIADSDRSTSFFHTSRWAQVCEEACLDCTAEARLYRFEDGNEVLLPAASLRAAHGMFKCLVSVWPSDYGSMISTRPLEPAHIQFVAEDLKNSGFARVVLYENPFGERLDLEGYEPLPHTTRAIPLECGFEAAWEGRIDSTERRAVRSATRKGVTVSSGVGPDDVDEMYRMYMLSAQRWGDKVTWLRPLELLRAAVTHGGSDVSLHLARLGDRVIGGAVDYFHGEVAISAWRAFDYEYRNYFPNLLLVQESVREACERGCRLYDMGPSAGLPGVEAFKKRCGAVPFEFSAWVWESAAYKAYSLGRKGLAGAGSAVKSLAGAKASVIS